MIQTMLGRARPEGKFLSIKSESLHSTQLFFSGCLNHFTSFLTS